jgi:hypothetical protein
MADDRLSVRALNRSFLRRQMLLEREALSAEAAIERLVGMQAQVPLDPYVGLWSRLADFRPDELGDAITARRAVRMTLMRATIHLATSRDAVTIRPVLQDLLGRRFRSSPFQRDVDGLEIAPVLAAARGLISDRPRSRAELARLLAERWPDRDANSLGYATAYLMPLVQVPPRGVWGRSGAPRWTTVESWLGTELSIDRSPDALVLRYLVAFGPASAADIRSWSGLSDTAGIVDRLRPRLRPFRDASGRELVDVVDGPFPDPEMPAPVRFLPGYDNALLGHADRSRISGSQAPFLAKHIGMPTVLIDGFVRARWKVTRSRPAATIRISPLEPLSTVDANEVGAEAERLLAFLAEDATVRTVELTSSG